MTGAAVAGTAAWAQSDQLPIKRVLLFKNGVGFFEHLGTVRGNEPVSVGFTSGQLNDVLKSLTVLDLNGGRITGVSYGSAAPIERQMEQLRFPGGDKATLADFLGALRGTKVEVRNANGVITGRLLSVERRSRGAAGGSAVESDLVSLITDKGELRTAEISSAASVRLLEAGLAGKVDRFLDLLSAARETDVRKMVISTAGTGTRSIYVSYISEVPIWKATYRVVLNGKSGSAPLLQGWAIIDNVVGEDWNGVELSLVAGAPQSFIQNLSQPYFAQRPTIPLPQNVLTAPQTYQSTLTPGSAQLSGQVRDPAGAGVAGATVQVVDQQGNVAAQSVTDGSGAYAISSVPQGSFRMEVQAPGFQRATVNGLQVAAGNVVQQDVALQIGDQSQTVQLAGAPPPPAPAMQAKRQLSAMPRTLNRMETADAAYSRVDGARAAAQTAAQGQTLGDLFEYKMKEPITIQKDRSALVPIVQAPITAEKVSVWNENAGVAKPQRALYLTNTTGQTLDGGSVSVLEDEAFQGEGIVEPLQAGEKRLVSYATDLALTPSAKTASQEQRVSRVKVLRGTLIQESELRETKTYTFRNEDTSARKVIVEHPARTGWVLRSDTKPTETTASFQRFRLLVGAKQTASLVVEEARVLQTTFQVADLTGDQLAIFVRQGSIDKTTEAALRDVVSQKAEVDRLTNEKDKREGERQKIVADQQRVRENMKALKGTADEKALVQRYTQELNTQEDRLSVLGREQERLEAQIEAAQAKLESTIEKLSFDVKL
jgi:hypothetical protein